MVFGLIVLRCGRTGAVIASTLSLGHSLALPLSALGQVLLPAHANEKHTACQLANDESGSSVELDRDGSARSITVEGRDIVGSRAASTAAACFAVAGGRGNVCSGARSARIVEGPQRSGDSALPTESRGGQAASMCQKIAGSSGENSIVDMVVKVGPEECRHPLGQEEGRRRRYATRSRMHGGGLGANTDHLRRRAINCAGDD